MSTGIVKLKIDDSDPAFAKRLWIVFFLLGALIYTVALFVPTYLKIQGNSGTDYPKEVFKKLGIEYQPFDIENFPIFYIYKGDVSKLDQFLVVEGMPMQPSYLNRKDIAKISIKVSAFAVDENMAILDTMYEKKSMVLEHNCEHPKNGYCEFLPIAQISSLDHPGYVIVVEFVNYQEFKEAQVGEYAAAYFYVNPWATIVMLLFRYTLLFISIISLRGYTSKLSNMNVNNIADEQHQLKFLGWFTVGLNDPFYVVTVLYRFPIAAYLSTGLILIFVANLYYFWISMLEKIANNRKISGVGKGAATLYTIAFFGLVGITYLYNTYRNLGNPLLYWDTEESQLFEFLKFLLYCINVVGAIWFVIRSVGLFFNRESLAERDSSFLLFSTFFMICYVIFVMTGSLQVYNDNLIRETLFYGLTNLYIGFMLHLFTPPKGDEIELMQLGKNEESSQQDHPTDDEKGKDE